MTLETIKGEEKTKKKKKLRQNKVKKDVKISKKNKVRRYIQDTKESMPPLIIDIIDEYYAILGKIISEEERGKKTTKAKQTVTWRRSDAYALLNLRTLQLLVGTTSELIGLLDLNKTPTAFEKRVRYYLQREYRAELTRKALHTLRTREVIDQRPTTLRIIQPELDNQVTEFLGPQWKELQEQNIQFDAEKIALAVGREIIRKTVRRHRNQEEKYLELICYWKAKSKPSRTTELAQKIKEIRSTVT